MTSCSTAPMFFRRGCGVLVIVALQYVTDEESSVNGNLRNHQRLVVAPEKNHMDFRDPNGCSLRCAWRDGRRRPSPHWAVGGNIHSHLRVCRCVAES